MSSFIGSAILHRYCVTFRIRARTTIAAGRRSVSLFKDDIGKPDGAVSAFERNFVDALPWLALHTCWLVLHRIQYVALQLS